MCASALDSCKRIFDVDCRSCDEIEKTKSQKDWISRLLDSEPTIQEMNECREYLPYLVEATRGVVRGWGKGSSNIGPSDNTYVPDRQGCYETTQVMGGTLGTSTEEEIKMNNLVRLGVAKTKGKFRVVTMQGARVKRVLAPVHNGLYNHISRKSWCVRGDVTVDDFRAVYQDCREGERIISGDYVSATDNILLPAVQSIVSVILEEATDLEDEERKVFEESFGRSYVKYKDESGHMVMKELRRGSMMGNLCSFPLLCILNRACFIITNRILGRGRRVGRFNGDDCIFAGDDLFLSHLENSHFEIWTYRE